jgi:hypothetical protein
MAQSGHSTMTRPIDEMVTEIHNRATAIRRRRSRKQALASVSGLAPHLSSPSALVARSCSGAGVAGPFPITHKALMDRLVHKSGTCTNLLVTLVGDPANPYSAGIARWTGAAMSAPLTRTP